MKKRLFLVLASAFLLMSLGACEDNSQVVVYSSSSSSSQTSGSSGSSGGSSQGGSSGGQSSSEDSSSEDSSSAESSSEESSSEESSSSEEITNYPYYAVLGTDEFPLSQVENPELVSGQLAEYRAELGNIVKDTPVKILDSDKQELTENFNAEDGNNNVDGPLGEYKVRFDAENAFLLVKTWESGWTNFYISGWKDESLDYPYFVQLGEEQIGVPADDNPELAANQVAQYKVDLGNVTKGTSIAILDAELNPLTENFNAETGENNVSGELGSYVIHNDAENAFLLIKTWESGWTNFYVSGYETSTDVVEVTINVTKDVGDGNRIYLVGDFCDWSVTNENVIAFNWTDGNVWTTGALEIEKDAVYHCKLVIAAYENPTAVSSWEKDGTGNERLITFTESTTLNLEWGNY